MRETRGAAMYRIRNTDRVFKVMNFSNRILDISALETRGQVKRTVSLFFFHLCFLLKLKKSQCCFTAIRFYYCYFFLDQP